MGNQKGKISSAIILTGTIVAILNIVVYQWVFIPRINKSFEEFKSELQQENFVQQERWKIKRDACINALNVADAILSNYSYPNVKPEDLKKGYVSTEDVRKCINELATACDSSEVLEVLKDILFGKNITPDIIVDLRNAVRKELEFGNYEIDNDRDTAFVGIVICDRQ